MVAVIFRLLDALRIFDLIYVLTPNSSATKTMSIISRENLIDFDNFAYGSAQSTLLFLIIALSVILYIWLGRVDLGGEKQVMPMVKTGLFYLAVVLIVVVAVFPFYYAIITSFKTGTALFEVNYWPTAVLLAELRRRVRPGRVPAQHPELDLRRDDDGGDRAAARGHRLLRAGARAVPRADAAAADHPRGLDVPADRRARRACSS